MASARRIRFTARTQLRLARLAAALKPYHLQTGRPAAFLAVFVPDVPDALPRDPNARAAAPLRANFAGRISASANHDGTCNPAADAPPAPVVPGVGPVHRDDGGQIRARPGRHLPVPRRP